MKKRNIAVVTGSRAEYGYLKPLIRRIRDSKQFRLLLYVAGMHLMKSRGYSVQEITKDGFSIQTVVPMGKDRGGKLHEIPFSIAKGITGFTRAFIKDKPDIVIVLGDRIEPFSAAVSAATLSIPVAHINGGDISGNIDDSLRHAITKLSHIHFPATELSAERIIKLGEEKWRIHNVGALSLDTILHEKVESFDKLCLKYHMPKGKYILLTYHPVTTEWKDSGTQIRHILQAVETMRKENMYVVIVYPNSDPGGEAIIREVDDFSQKHKHVYLFKNLPHRDFLSFLNSSSVFVGNSSAGIIEAPSFGIPYVCVGTRQLGRETAQNVIYVDYDKEDIVRGIKKAFYDKTFLDNVKKHHNPYGNGTASQKIVRILETVALNERIIKKKMTY